jgi:hypothetical protein
MNLEFGADGSGFPGWQQVPTLFVADSLQSGRGRGFRRRREQIAVTDIFDHFAALGSSLARSQHAKTYISRWNGSLGKESEV